MRMSVEEYIKIGIDFCGYIEPQVTSQELYPAYLREEAEDTVRKVQSQQTFHTVTFGMITDTHYAARLNLTYTIRLRRTLQVYREIAKRVSPVLLAMGGDHANDGTKEYKSDCLRELRAELSGIPYFPVNGNHDDGSIWDISFVPSPVSVNHLEPQERYTLFYNHLPTQGAVFDPNHDGLYYYYDIPAEKVRFIFLDTDDFPYVKDNGKLRYYPQQSYAVSQYQLDWLTKTALRFPEPGWSVILISHVPPVHLCGHPENLSHISAIHSILRAYRAGEVCELHQGEGDLRQDVAADFAADPNRAEIVGMFHGHVHADAQKIVDGIPYMTTGNSVMYADGGLYLPRQDGDKSELLFDIITVDKAKRTVSAVRVGAGEDRVYHY